MKASLLQEPELEFGTGRHIDIRFGLMSYGPVDFTNSPASRIRIGIVGTPETIEDFANWVEKCRLVLPARKSNHPYLFPKFPGWSPDTNLKSTVEIGRTACRPINERDITALYRNQSRKAAIEGVAKLFLDEVEYLASMKSVMVIVCAPPDSFLRFVCEPAPNGTHGRGQSRSESDFHDWLKAHAMGVGVPIQVVWPSTYDETKMLTKSRNPDQPRRLQDEATRAWNLHLALYYKAGGVPWRMCRSASDLTTLFVGVSFYKSLDNSHLATSLAQVFNERGEGVILRGGTAALSKQDLQVHLDATSAYQLLDDAILKYRREHFTVPARIVLHKSSSFDAAELEGFRGAIGKHNVHSADLMHIGHSDMRAFRAGTYPPLRGTFITLEDRNHLLYTRGSVEFFSVYPGMYVPHPLHFRSQYVEQTATSAAQEILALTKMNWNNTQFDGLEPITIRAARQVGSILKYVDQGGLPYQPRYSFYM
jgi:hypothetical protein